MFNFKKVFKNIYVIIFVGVFIFSMIFLTIIGKRAMPAIMSYASVQTKKVGIEVLRNCGLKEVNNTLKNKELYVITTNNNGEIESIDFNTIVLNDTLMIVAKNVRKRLKEVESGHKLPDQIYNKILDKKLKKGIIYEIPIGVATNNSLLMNAGPKIPVKIEYAGNVSLDVKTKVSEYGINSALIEVYINVEVTQRTILPFQSKDEKITSEVPVIMKVVKGSASNILASDKKSYSLPMN